MAVGVQGGPAPPPELRHQLGGGGAVAVEQLVQQPLQVRRDLDVHAGREGGLHRLGDQLAGLDEPADDVVGVGGGQQAADGQPHAPGHVAGVDVAEVAGGHAERGGPLAAEAAPGPDVVDDLGHHPGPVDGVDRGQAGLGPQGLVGEHGLDQVLAVVEGPVDGHRPDVGGVQGGHLAALDLAGPPVGVQHHDVDAVAVAHRLHGRRAGVAGGGPDDHRPPVPNAQLVVEEPAHELEGHVLEGAGGPVEQLQKMVVVVQGGELAHVGLVEGVVGLPDQGRQLVGGHRAGREGGHHPGGQIPVQAGGRVRRAGHPRQPGSPLGHVEPAVGRGPRQQDVGEPERGGPAPRAHVSQVTRLSQRHPSRDHSPSSKPPV